MKLIDGCHSLKLECALRELGFVDIGWKCVAHAGIFFVHRLVFLMTQREIYLDFILQFSMQKTTKRLKCYNPHEKHLTLHKELTRYRVVIIL